MTVYEVIERVIWENCHSHPRRIGLAKDTIVGLAHLVEDALLGEMRERGESKIAEVGGRLEFTD